MLLLIGLGNLGQEFENTRHNIGFKLIDYLVNSYNLKKMSNSFKSTLYKGVILNYNVILAKPGTMMNCSGEAVRLIKNVEAGCSFFHSSGRTFWAPTPAPKPACIPG